MDFADSRFKITAVLLTSACLLGCSGGSDSSGTDSSSSSTSSASSSSSSSTSSSASSSSTTSSTTPVVKFDPSLCTAQAGAPYGQTVGITGTNMMVTSADVQASAAGCRILAAGGSAIDAAITGCLSAIARDATVTDAQVSDAAKIIADWRGHGMREKCMDVARKVLEAAARGGAT